MYRRTTAALGLALLVTAVVRADKPAPKAGPKPADPFGYSVAFDESLKKIGQISPADFARRFALKSEYLDKLSFDPTSAKFFADFNLNVRGAGLPATAYDFRMNADELAAFKRNGFVVSERMGAASFGQMLYRIYSRDLPVYVTADALLQAWHRSYDSMLEQLEETYLATSLEEILTGMANAVPDAHKAYGDGALADGLKDADYFLAMARSLLANQTVRTHLGQDERVEKTLKACERLGLEEFILFGRERVVDFSQFKVRGHYEHSDLLKKYFKAMMWCGRIDLRVAGNPEESSPREMAGAVVLHDLIRRAGKFDQWKEFDRMIQTFVGVTDSMTFAQLGAVLAKAGIKSATDVKDFDTLERVQKEVVKNKAGAQAIRGDFYYSPLGPEKLVLPASFTVLGQKFALDSWATGKVVYDDILWNDRKVQRRIPSGLDVAFGAFGNDQVVPLLVERMTATDGRRFRDGLPYQHNLTAVREVVEAQSPSAWDENLYTLWLSCLRELSKPTTDGKYPEVLRTKPWAMRNLNTQLASWSQLRHDTILYVKQSYTASTLCYYPAGYVEPLPEFWARFEKMATRAADLVEKTPFPDRTIEKPYIENHKIKINLKDVQKSQATFFRNFAKQIAVLRGIAEKELAARELTKDEEKFLKKIVEIQFRGSGGPFYTGWYFGMFYKGHEDADKWDALVADVHTDTPDSTVGDPGCVLHQGVGNVDLLLVAIDSGKDKMVYAGPVFSHYEFEMPEVGRKSDSEWRKELREGKAPSRPSWAKSFLVPGVNPDAKDYQHGADK